MKYWINENKNVKQIKIKLEEDYNIDNVDTRFIYAFVSNLRKAIAVHLRNTYILDRLANINDNQRIAVDESFFTHNANVQQWVVGLINIDTKEIRLELVSNRNQNTLKYIIEKHVGRGNIINKDSWPGYNFISNVNSGYVHNVYNHSNGVFGLTSLIESIWAELKNSIKKCILQFMIQILFIFSKKPNIGVTLNY